MQILEEQPPLTAPAVDDAVGLRVSVVLPTLNEVENIVPLIEQIYEAVPDLHECVVVDDDSPDGTADAVRRYAATVPHRNVRVEQRKEDHGLTRSLSHGIKRCTGNVIVWMDCDFSMPPSLIPALLQCIENGYDIAVGSRFVRGGSFKRNIADSSDSALAVLLSRMMNYVIQVVLDHSFKDYTSGFIAVRKSVFKEIGLQGNYGEYFIDFIYKAIYYGFRITEVPYICLPRLKGVSKTGQNIFQFTKLGMRYVKIALRLRLLPLVKKAKSLRPVHSLGLSSAINAGALEIRAMRGEDVPLVAGLHHQVLYETLNSRLGIPHLEDLYGALLSDPDARCWVAVQENRILGFVSASKDLQKTRDFIGRNLLWRDRIMSGVHVLTSWKDLKEFLSGDLFFKSCVGGKAPYATILTLGVSPFAQRRSVGRRLIEEVSRSFQEMGRTAYHVDTRFNNEPALAFYARNGFSTVRTFLGNVVLVRNF